jgi:hypothetical protein
VYIEYTEQRVGVSKNVSGIARPSSEVAVRPADEDCASVRERSILGDLYSS